jgi:hypothetical protein
MQIKFILTLIVPAIIVSACTKYRDVPSKYGAFTAPPDGTIAFGSLRINEFICKGSDPGAVTTLGCNAKWFELYNPTNTDITLNANEWYVTDTLGIKNKCAVTQNTVSAQWKVPAKGFLVICCPKAGSTTPSPTRFNASFSLSSTSGAIGIYYKPSGAGTYTAVDTLLYNFAGGASSGVSYGRKPDGQDPATTQLPAVTAEASNN